MGKVAYTVMGEVFNSYVGAEERVMEEPPTLREAIEEVALRKEQFVIDGKIVSQPPETEYQVQLEGVEIPFWGSLEAAKACVIAINDRPHGPKARLMSCQEVEL